MTAQIQHRQLEDRLTLIAGQCVRPDGTVVDLSGLTVKFEMTDSEGTATVAETTDNVTVNDATNGKVSYAPAVVDVDTEGTYHAYFRAYSGALAESFPVKTGDYQVIIHPRT